MTRLLERLRQSRVLGELYFLLGGAAAGAVSGALLVLVIPPRPVPAFASAPAWIGVFLIAARGFLVGWWGGLAWSVILVLAARRRRPPFPVKALLPATVLAATALLGIATVAVVAALPPQAAAVLGLLAAAVTARLSLGRAAGRADR